MVPTIFGRIEKRIFVLLVVGGLWTLLTTPVLPIGPGTNACPVAFAVLITVIVLGVGWTLPYHGLQQFLGGKDRPVFSGLITVLNEGVSICVLLSAGLVPTAPEIPGPVFTAHGVSA